MMRIAVYGAGAIGGHLAARLGQLPGAAISVVARGSHLAAIRADGLELLSGGERLHIRPTATDDPSTLPAQDIVFVTLKAPAIAAAATQIARLGAPDGIVVFVVNGLPWWMEDPAPDSPLAAIDRGRILGGVVYSSNFVERPGRVVHLSHNAWFLGEPDGGSSERVRHIAKLMGSAGLDTRIHPDLRHEVWHKLIYNASSNPLAALTRQACDGLVADPALYALGLAIRHEIAAIAAGQGHDFAGAAALASLDDLAAAGGARPSMLQDVLAGREIESDAIVDAPRRIARRAGIPTPALDAVSALLNALGRSLVHPGTPTTEQVQ